MFDAMKKLLASTLRFWHIRFVTHLEQKMYMILRTIKDTDWAHNHKFAYPARGWEIDFAEPRLMIAIECEGGTWMGKSSPCNQCGDYRSKQKTGRHTSGAGFKKDCEKYNAAEVMGWSVLRYTTGQIQKEPLTIRSQIEQLIARQRDAIGLQYRLDVQHA